MGVKQHLMRLQEVSPQQKRPAVRDLRVLLASIRFVRRTAVQTTVHLITTGLILALLAGITLKLKVFGPGG